MALATDKIAETFINIVASTPIDCNWPLYAEDEVVVVYGQASLTAVYPTDYTVTLSPPNYNTFQITPTAALLTKINNLIIASPTTEVNYVTVRRVLDNLTSVQPETVRGVPYLSREIERVWMGIQQVAESVGRALSYPRGEVSGDAVASLPSKTLRALKALVFDADGNLVVSNDDYNDQATDAAASAAAALASQNTASASASSASTSAGTATTQAGIATTQAGIATTAATDAVNAADAVVAQWVFSVLTTMAFPGTGGLRLNNASSIAATEIAISEVSANIGGPNFAGWLASFDDSTNPVKGTLTLRALGSNAFVIYNVSAVTDNGTWVTLSVAGVTAVGSFADNAELAVTFSRAGDIGPITASSAATFTNKIISAFTNTLTNLFTVASSSGVLDWNDVTNTKEGMGTTLLLGTATNGPGGAQFFYPFNLIYAPDGNITQYAIPYSTSTENKAMWMRQKHTGGWHPWRRVAVGEGDVCCVTGVQTAFKSKTPGLTAGTVVWQTVHGDTFPVYSGDTRCAVNTAGLPNGNFIIAESGYYHFEAQIYVEPPGAGESISMYLGLFDLGTDGLGANGGNVNNSFRVANEAFTGGTHPSLHLDVKVRINLGATGPRFYAFRWYYLDGTPVTPTLNLQTLAAYCWASITKIRNL